MRGCFCAEGGNISYLPLTERLKNFRGQLNLELLLPEEVETEAVIPLRIAVTNSAYLLRLGIQLGQFLAKSLSDDRQEAMCLETEASKSEIVALLAVVDSLDFLDIACALGGTSAGTTNQTAKRTRTCSRLTLVQATPCQLRKLASTVPYGERRAALQLSIDDYVRHDDSFLAAPIGIKSDVELLVDTAVSCFYEWTASGRQQLEQIFALLDKDDDGSVSGQDMVDQLREAGQSTQASSFAAEMTRLLCHRDVPSVRVFFYHVARPVSDSVNEHRVLSALQQLFLGSAA